MRVQLGPFERPPLELYLGVGGLSGSGDQLHAHALQVLWHRVTLLIIALLAGTHSVGPRELPTPAAGYDVVEGQLRDGPLLAAVLALKSIPDEHVSPGHHGNHVGLLVVPLQSDDRGKVEAAADRAHHDILILRHDNSLPVEDGSKCILPSPQRQWDVR
eukprot:CAMPEP_0173194276 /NCGR_PEP_ID=MMETSP1141-20130122/14424_1 /TAXON_ID=483371 /ORGANISM="non described non described, Strain CCMP2298" /LENGTH=158 /DNA_ID=CAMNT_0014118705 /DNA_START=330 /DNA_END=806 /DNA_ORIENTATION=+